MLLFQYERCILVKNNEKLVRTGFDKVQKIFKICREIETYRVKDFYVPDNVHISVERTMMNMLTKYGGLGEGGGGIEK